MSEVIKTIKETEDIFRLTVLKILCLDPEAEENQGRVRFPWGSNLGGADNGFAVLDSKTEDICVITILPKNDIYNRQRDIKYKENSGGISLLDRGGRDLTLIDEHTDVHEVTFCNYGEHAYECARKIRDGLFRREIKRLLLKNNFALVADVPAIRRVPELYNNEWWNRCDFTATFNEFVRLEDTEKTIEKINVHVKTVINSTEITKKISVNKRNLKTKRR